MSWLVFPNSQAAQQREKEISTALGYPDSTGIYTRYATPIEHPAGGQWALVITTVCDASADVYIVRDVEEMLSDNERASLKTDEEMKNSGWWGEPEEEEPTP